MKRRGITIEVRKAIIERDNATCQVCGKIGTRTTRGGKPVVVEYLTDRAREYDGNESITFHFHHKIPVFLDGSDDQDNLELRCQKCNSREKFTNMVRNYLKIFEEVLQSVSKTGDN